MTGKLPVVLAGLGLALVACTGGKAGDTAETAELPEETGQEWTVDTSGFTLDTFSETGFDQDPDHALFLYHDGRLALAPDGGPWTEVAGELYVLELLDVERIEDDTGYFATVDTADTAETGTGVDTSDTAEPVELPQAEAIACRAGFVFLGEVDATTDPDCPSCEATFRVEFDQVVGNGSACRDPDAPLDGDVWHLGWSSADETLYLNYLNAGTWVPWYATSGDGEDLVFAWASKLAVQIEEDDR